MVRTCITIRDALVRRLSADAGGAVGDRAGGPGSDHDQHPPDYPGTTEEAHADNRPHNRTARPDDPSRRCRRPAEARQVAPAEFTVEVNGRAVTQGFVGLVSNFS